MKKQLLLLLFVLPVTALAQYQCITIKGRHDGTFQQANVSSASPGTSDTTQQEIVALTTNCSGYWWKCYTMSFLHYNISVLPVQSHIVSAVLHLKAKRNNMAGSPGHPTLPGEYGTVTGAIMNVHTPWSPATITWDNIPATDVGTMISMAPVVSDTQDFSTNITPIVQSWLTDPTTNNGLALAIQGESDASLVFCSGEAADSLQPTLDICYYSGPPVVCNGWQVLTGNLTDGKFKQVEYSAAPWAFASDTSQAEIGAYSIDVSDETGYKTADIRTIMRYDVSAIPANSYISSARLYLYGKVDNSLGMGEAVDGYINGWLSRLTSPWTADSLVVHSHEPTEDAGTRQTLLFDDNFYPPKSNYMVDITKFVREWVKHPGTNYGMRLQMEQESNGGYMFFNSGQAADALKPRLEICYDTTGIPSDCTARYRDTILPTDRFTHYYTALADTSAGRTPSAICWSFGDGADSCVQYDSSHPFTGTPMAHTYPAEQNYNVSCVTIHYTDGCQSSYCDSLRRPSICTAAFTVDADGPENRRFYFRGMFTNDAGKTPVRACLSFGDGTDTCIYYGAGHPYTPLFVAHTYVINDSVQACMTVQYEDSCSAQYCVGVPPSALCDEHTLVIRASPTESRFMQAVLKQPISVDEGTGPGSDVSQLEMPAAQWTCSTDGCSRRTLFRYDVSEIPADATVRHAYLYLYAKTDNVFGIPGRPMVSSSDGNRTALLKVAAPWSPYAVRWRNQPGTWGSQYARYMAQSDTPRNYSMDVTDIVQRWVNRADSNYGWQLRIAIEQDIYNSMVFYSGQGPDSLRARLSICYALPGDTLAARQMASAVQGITARLYPNPATDALTITIKSNLPQTGAVFLYDLQGRMVQVLKNGLRLSAGDNIIRAGIDRSRIPAGMYFVKIQLGNGLRTYKVTLR